MTAPVQMGPNAVSNPAALIGALKSQQPAPNPTTPNERVNPDQQVLEHIKAAQVSMDRAKAYTNDEHIKLALDVMSGTLTKAMLKFDGMSVLQSLQQAVQSLPPMVAPAPGGLQTPGGPPGGGPMMGAPAAPPQPGAVPAVPGGPLA